MRTPSFWQSKNLLSTALLPASAIYEALVAMRWRRADAHKLPVPVLCIGNLTAGGAGKTPVAMAVAKLLADDFPRAFFLSRGYGGTARGPLLVDPLLHSAAQVGDEPLLLARILPTVICRDRVAGGRFAVERGAGLIVMDDGFQNPSLHKDCSLLVIDARQGFGNGRLLPAGPLRERPAAGFARAQALILTGLPPQVSALPAHLPVFNAAAQIEGDASRFAGKRYVAFSGIAHPQKFFDTLVSLGAELAQSFAFGDHHVFSAGDIARLRRAAAGHGAPLITTEKDAVRLPAALRAETETLPIRMDIAEPQRLKTLLMDYLKP